MKNLFYFLYTKQSTYVQLTFIIISSLVIIPSGLIIYAILSTPKLRNINNYLVLPISLIDAFYALFILIWFPIKLYFGDAVMNVSSCQFEGFINGVCKLTWLYTAMIVAAWRYKVVVASSKLFDSLTPEKFLQIQSLQCVMPLLAASAIALSNRFGIMPSGGYCYLLFNPTDPVLYLFYYLNLLFIGLPCIIAIYFYWSITEHYTNIADSISDMESSVQSSDLIYYKLNQKSSFMHESQIKSRAVAFKSISYGFSFLFSFLPFGCTMLAELVTSKPRTPTLDAVMVTLVLFHKVASPITTLYLNEPVFTRIKGMFKTPVKPMNVLS